MMSNTWILLILGGLLVMSFAIIVLLWFRIRSCDDWLLPFPVFDESPCPPSEVPPPHHIDVCSCGADSTGKKDSKAAIDDAINKACAERHKTVWFPAGIYRVVMTKPRGKGYYVGVHIPDDIQLLFHASAIIEAETDDPAGYSSAYVILDINGRKNVGIYGGTLKGERASHPSFDSNGEGGTGISVKSSNNVTIQNVTIKDCWGDGIYLGGDPLVKNVKICGVTAENDRRCGLAIVNAQDVAVLNSTFWNTNGTLLAPVYEDHNGQRVKVGQNNVWIGEGINIEPNKRVPPDPKQHVKDVLVIGCEVSGNRLLGVKVDGGDGAVQNVKILGNQVFGNGIGGKASGFFPEEYVSPAADRGGVVLRCQDVRNVEIKLTEIQGNAGPGIRVLESDCHSVELNEIIENGYHGVWLERSTGTIVARNRIKDSGKNVKAQVLPASGGDNIMLEGARRSAVIGNTCGEVQNGYAIHISDSTSKANFVVKNRVLPAGLEDKGSNTINSGNS